MTDAETVEMMRQMIAELERAFGLLAVMVERLIGPPAGPTLALVSAKAAGIDVPADPSTLGAGA